MRNNKTKVLLGSLALAMMAVSGGTGGASAVETAGHKGGNDTVDGTFTSVFGTRFHINAISGPFGEDPRGHFYVEHKDPQTGAITLDFVGFVTCLDVQVNEAMIGGEIDRSKSDLPVPGEGNGVLLYVKDDGSPGDLDIVNGVALLAPLPVCSPVIPITNVHMQGNMFVHDEEF